MGPCCCIRWDRRGIEGPLLVTPERPALCHSPRSSRRQSSKHTEVPQGGLNDGFDLRRDFNRFYALRQRPALASLRDDAMFPLDLGDIPGRNLQPIFLQYPRLDIPVGGTAVGRNVGRRLVVQEDVLPAFQKFSTYGEWRRFPSRVFERVNKL